MIYLGIDVAKASHVTTVITSDGKVILKPFSFANSSSRFTKLKSRSNEFPHNSLLIGLESTEYYGENLIAKSMMIDGCRLLEPGDIQLLKLRGLYKTG